MKMREIINLDESLLTESRGGHLYHKTSVEKADQIISSDVLKANTNQLIGARRGERIEVGQDDEGNPIYKFDMEGGQIVKGVSLTRSYEFALNWRGSVILVFDHRKISQRFKLIPLDHLASGRYDYDSPGVDFPDEWRNQEEEFLVGSITPVSKFLVSVNVEIPDLDNTDMFSAFSNVYRHPLLNKVYPRAYRRWYERFHYEKEHSGEYFNWSKRMRGV